MIFFILLIFTSACTNDISNCPNKQYRSISEAFSGISRDSWLSSNTMRTSEEINWFNNSKDISNIAQSDIFFVPVNKIPLAVQKLKSNDAIKLSSDNMKYYAGNHFKIVKGKAPYLVRAMFENFTGSDFDIKWHSKKKVLKISYNSLGISSPKGRFFSPLVVNLPTKPRYVILEFGGAK